MPDNDSSANNPQEPDHYFSAIPISERRKIWERICRPPTAQETTRAAAKIEPLTDFDRDFFRLVEPKLTGFVKLSAYMVRLQLESFSEAHNRVMHAAQRYGATHLSDTAFWKLDEWIDRAILAWIDEPPPEGVVTPEQLARIMREVP